MEKYKHYNIIRPDDIQNYRGLQNEVLTHFHSSGWDYPLWISCFGITYPTPNYAIKRAPVSVFVLEHVITGKGYVVCNGKKHTVVAGDTYLLRKGQNVEYFSDEKDPYQKLWVNFSGDLPAYLVSSYNLKDVVYKNVKLIDLFEKLYALDKVSNDYINVQYEATTLVTEMLLRLAKSIDTREKLPEIAIAIRSELYHFIYTSYNLNTVAQKLFLSKSEVIRHFKNAYHVTPYKYLLDLKIDHAKMMLETSSYSVKEIASILSFSSPYHLSETFKNRVGVSPMQYRKQLQEPKSPTPQE